MVDGALLETLAFGAEWDVLIVQLKHVSYVLDQRLCFCSLLRFLLFKPSWKKLFLGPKLCGFLPVVTYQGLPGRLCNCSRDQEFIV